MMGAIYDEVIRQRGELVAAGKQPRSVIFSTEGFNRMLHERDSTDVRAAVQGTTYCGLPHTVDRRQSEDVVVSEQSVEEWAAAKRSVPAVSFRVDGLDPRKTTMELAGGSLTRAQLSDLLSAWVDAHPNEHLVTTPLVDWIQTHGRFE